MIRVQPHQCVASSNLILGAWVENKHLKFAIMKVEGCSRALGFSRGEVNSCFY